MTKAVSAKPQCTTCGSESDETSTGESGQVCQDCWESECSRSFWEFVNTVNNNTISTEPVGRNVQH